MIRHFVEIDGSVCLTVLCRNSGVFYCVTVLNPMPVQIYRRVIFFQTYFHGVILFRISVRDDLHWVPQPLDVGHIREVSALTYDTYTVYIIVLPYYQSTVELKFVLVLTAMLY